MFTKISIAAFFAGLAAAYHEPVGAPNGNAIRRPLNEIVPAGQPFQITWDNSTYNSVSLVLLKGPSTNVVPLYPIVEGIPNTGKYVWTPKTDLEATTGPNGYGIQIIDDVNGQFQYSTQFGISSSGKPAESKPVDKQAPPATSGYAVATPIKPTTMKTTAHPAATTPCTTTTAYVPAGTGKVHPPTNGTTTYPTGAVPPKPKPSAPTGNTTAPFFPGAASGLQAGVGLAGAAAALVLLI